MKYIEREGGKYVEQPRGKAKKNSPLFYRSIWRVLSKPLLQRKVGSCKISQPKYFEAYLRKKHHYRGRDAPDENPEQKKN
ncbi:hypothetical protein [Paenibacillus validus]|uniref:hypothetical protein n=1 Tax=Paenibacillus validus TaxID=44253 RepID=UPI003D287D40